MLRIAWIDFKIVGPFILIYFKTMDLIFFGQEFKIKLNYTLNRAKKSP